MIKDIKIYVISFILGFLFFLGIIWYDSQTSHNPTQEDMIEMAIEYDKVHGTDYADVLIDEYLESRNR